MNRQQADDLRRANEARSAAEYRKTQASFAASNARAQAAHQASERAASTAAHNRRMAEYARGGENLRKSMFDSMGSGTRVSQRTSHGSGSSSSGASKSGGLLFIAIVVVGFLVFGHSNSNSSSTGSTANPAPIVDGSSSGLSSKPSAGTEIAPQPKAEDQQPPATTSAVAELPAGSPFSVTQPSSAKAAEPANTSSPPDAANAPAELPVVTRPYVPESQQIHLEARDKVTPLYPSIARQAHVGGTVTVTVTVLPDGSVERVQPTSGSPMLMQAAIDAARRWRFQPYTATASGALPTTTINFNFNQD